MSRLDGSLTLARYRLGWADPAFWLAAVLFYLLFPQYLSIGTTVLITALFALSYDLVIGFAGILTLGQAAYFGIGAYAAGLIAKHLWSEPVTGALAAGLVSAAAAAPLAPFVLRLTGMPLIMVTLGISVIVLEAGNKAVWLTGGDDGLSGFTIAPLFGRFDWSIFSYTQYLYALGWLFLLFYLLRRVVSSPFGVALQGIRENSGRMKLVGTPVLRYQAAVYVISAGVAGIAGALLAQTTAFVGLGVLGLDTTLDGLVIVVLGGVGTLYGVLIGAPVYLFLKYFTQQWNPSYWMLVIGALLIVVVRFARGGLLGMLGDVFSEARAAVRRRRFERMPR